MKNIHLKQNFICVATPFTHSFIQEVERSLTSLMGQPIGRLSLSALWEVTEILEEPG